MVTQRVDIFVNGSFLPSLQKTLYIPTLTRQTPDIFSAILHKENRTDLGRLLQTQKYHFEVENEYMKTHLKILKVW